MSNSQYATKHVTEISRFAAHLVGNWRGQGYSYRQINNELDRRILLCGAAVVDNYLATFNSGFNLTLFKYTTLTYCHSIFVQHKYLPPVTEAMWNDEVRQEVLAWHLTVKQPTRSHLMRCAYSLLTLASFKDSAQPILLT